MNASPSLVVFDVVGTLEFWFTRLLHAAFASTLAAAGLRLVALTNGEAGLVQGHGRVPEGAGGVRVAQVVEVRKRGEADAHALRADLPRQRFIAHRTGQHHDGEFGHRSSHPTSISRRNTVR